MMRIRRATSLLAMTIFLASTTAASATGIVAQQSAIALTLSLKLHNKHTLDRLVEEQATPESPLYHHFLSVEQFRELFAPTFGEYRATLIALHRAGFTIVRIDPNRTLIDVTASPATVERTFRTVLTPVVEGHRFHYAAMRWPTLPAVLPFVQAVVGLERTTSIAPVTASPIHMQARSPMMASSPFYGPYSTFGPSAVEKALDFPIVHGITGRGVKVADINPVPPVGSAANPSPEPPQALDSGAAQFLKYFHVMRTGSVTKFVSIDGSPQFEVDPNAWLNAEWIFAAAPGVSLYEYDFPDSSLGQLVDAYNQIVSDNIVDVVNMFYSVCEADAPNLEAELDPIIEQGAAEGIAFESSQPGPAGCGNPELGYVSPTLPGDSAYGLSVGGSKVVVNSKTGELESESGYAESGGGISLVVPGFAAQRLPGVNPSGRNTPDILLPAVVNGDGPAFYYLVSSSTSGTVYDWNTWSNAPYVNSAPAAGLLASYTQMSKHRLGAFDITLYKLFKKYGYGRVFHDITTGCNGTMWSPPICAKKGYDITAGIGSIDGYALGELLEK